MNELKGLTKDPEFTKLNQEVGLTNDNLFNVKQLATLVRLAGAARNPQATIQLGVLVEGHNPILIPYPVDEKNEMDK